MLKTILSSLVLVFIVGCGDNGSTTVKVNNTTGQGAGALIVFDSTGGNIPYPNNILFAATTAETIDGTLNIPFNPTDSDAAVKSALNTLTGFSTTSPISVSFTGKINPSSLVTGLKFYEILAEANASTGNVPIIKGIIRDLKFGEDYIATTNENKIIILPLIPLKSDQNYMIVLTKDIKNDENQHIAPDLASDLLLSETPLFDTTGNHTALSDDKAKTFEGIRQATQALIGYTMAQRAIARENIVTAWSFKTQEIGDTAQAFADQDTTGSMGLVNSTLTSKEMLQSSSMKGNADVYVGTLSHIPYYLAKATSSHDTAPLRESFVFQAGNTLPDVNATISIPVLATVPNDKGNMPAAGWPVVIFQHGITQDRTNLLAISEAFATIGYAAVAIDLPLHGIDDNTSGLYMQNIERTFDLDLVNNSTGAAGPDGIIDSSGTHYINLASLLTSRDNIRQTTSDLFALLNSFGNVVATDGLKFDSSNVSFVGHSLGTIASFGFLNHASNLKSVTLAMPGGGIAQLLNNSVSFGPKIEAGLASKGVIKGTTAYSSFMLATQTILDDADPLNYAQSVGVKQNILAIEVIGGQNGGLPDQVIPNNSPADRTFQLYGTEPLLQLLATTNLTATTAIKPNQAARFLEGDHGSVLDPTSSLSATVEMQTEVATFVASKGTGVVVTTGTLLRNP